MASDEARLAVRMEAQFRAFERAVDKLTGDVSTKTRKISGDFEKATSRIDRLMSSTAQSVEGSMGRIAGALGIGISAGSMAAFANEWQSAINKIAASGEPVERAGARLSQLTDIAMRSRSGLDGTVDLYTGLRRATEQLEPSQAQLLRVVENVNKAFAVSGASTQMQQAGVMQLSQALGSGALQGDELRSIRENAPLLAKAIADSLNVPIAKLKELGAEGKLTSDVVFKALLTMTQNVEQQFGTTKATIEQSLNNLKTAVTRYFGELDQANGISQGLAQGIGLLAQNVDAVGRVAAAAGVAMLAAFGPAVLGGVAALVSGPAGIIAAGAAIALFSDKITPIAGELASLADYATSAFAMIKEAGGAAWDSVSAMVSSAAQTIVSTLSGAATDAATAFSGLADAIKSVLNFVIGAFVAAGGAIVAAWNGVGPAIAEGIFNAMNAVVKMVNEALQKIASGINAVTGFVGMTPIAAPQFGGIENAYAGAGKAAGKAFSDAFSAVGKDYIGDVGKNIDGILGRIRESANASANARAEMARETQRGKAFSGGSDGSLGQKLKPLPKEADGGGGGGKGKGGGAEKDDEFDKELANIEKRINAMNREREALGLSAMEAARAEASHKLLDAAKAAGIPITEELRGKINALADAYATTKTRLDEAKSAQQAFKDLQQFLGTSLSGFFSDVVSGGKNAADALMNMTKKLADAAMQAVLLGQGPLGQLFGMGAKGGGVGGLIGALFGGGSGGGGFLSGILGGGGVASAPALAVGTSNVPRDMLAQIHKGEMVIPRYDADVLRKGGLAGQGGGIVTVELVASPEFDARIVKVSEGVSVRVTQAGIMRNNAQLPGMLAEHGAR